MPAGESVTTLARLGYRITPPRRAVLDAIMASPALFTIEDICATSGRVGRATVFRTMRLLQDAGLVCRVPLEDGSVRYQFSGGDHHHHLICRICGAISEFADPGLDARIQENAEAQGFALDAHSLELYGRCRDCSR